MRIKKTLKYIRDHSVAFGLGTIYGAVIGTVITYFCFAVTSGNIDVIKLLDIEECVIKARVNG